MDLPRRKRRGTFVGRIGHVVPAKRTGAVGSEVIHSVHTLLPVVFNEVLEGVIL